MKGHEAQAYTRTMVTGTGTRLLEAMNSAVQNGAHFAGLPEPIAYRVTIERWHMPVLDPGVLGE